MKSNLPNFRLSRSAAFAALGACALTLGACQSLQGGGPLQAESPPAGVATTTGVPRSHQRPPILSGPQIQVLSVPAGTARAAAPSQPGPSQAIGSSGALPTSPSQTSAHNPPGTNVVPSPDLPSLSHLINRPGLQGQFQSGAPTQPARPVMPPPATTDTVRAAILLPLSGRNEALGRALLNAAQLAVFDFADRRLELFPLDTKGTPQGAQKAAQMAIGDGAAVILGPLLGSSVRAIAPAARAAHVPVLAFSSDRSVAGSGIYTMGFLPADQVRRVMTYAYQRGLTRFAALAPDNTYGASVVDTLRTVARAIGAEVTAVNFYDPSAQDFTEVVRVLADYDDRRAALLKQRKVLEKETDALSKIALKRLETLQTIGDLPFDALLVADGGKRLQSVAALLPFYDVDPSKVRMLGTGQWDVPGIGAEPALLGGWYSAPAPSARADFLKLYQSTYGAAPPRLATMAYDAAALAAVLSRVDGGPDFSDATLTMPSGFDGRDGIFRFLPGGLAERGLAVLQVRKNDAKVISPAPATFETAIN
ncbi:MAG: ABC transporter substrate-binding protein [Rhodospirillaceae bacterium]|nr:ABC transporter substrate-binding protein [Rhodospirillaceae bacterium]